MNEIAEVEFETNLPLFFDSYRACRWTGSLILIDALTNATVGAAMIVGPVAAAASFASTETTEASLGDARRPALILLPGRAELVERVRDALVARGERAVVIDDSLIADSAVTAVVHALDLAGVIAVSSRTLSQDAITAIEGFAPGAVRVEDGANEEAILEALAGIL
jgi:bifunctional enzyme CysN/CysC/sulfate adenylyltransferase subunit 1